MHVKVMVNRIKHTVGLQPSREQAEFLKGYSTRRLIPSVMALNKSADGIINPFA